jgi:hypothetical protein
VAERVMRIKPYSKIGQAILCRLEARSVSPLS